MARLSTALDADTRIPLIEIDADYGKYVVGASEDGTVETIFAAPEYATSACIAQGFAKGKPSTNSWVVLWRLTVTKSNLQQRERR